MNSKEYYKSLQDNPIHSETLKMALWAFNRLPLHLAYSEIDKLWKFIQIKAYEYKYIKEGVDNE